MLKKEKSFFLEENKNHCKPKIINKAKFTDNMKTPLLFKNRKVKQIINSKKCHLFTGSHSVFQFGGLTSMFTHAYGNSKQNTPTLSLTQETHTFSLLPSVPKSHHTPKRNVKDFYYSYRHVPSKSTTPHFANLAPSL